LVSRISEKYRLRVFENRVLRNTPGYRRQEIIRDWGKLRNEELHGLYASQGIARAVR
jgi:hypothetical protein